MGIGIEAERVPHPIYLELAERLAPIAAGSALKLWTAPFVKIHGDYRLDNMVFGRGDGAPPITVVDWQGARLGPPLLDVAIYLGSCLAVVNAGPRRTVSCTSTTTASSPPG